MKKFLVCLTLVASVLALGGNEAVAQKGKKKKTTKTVKKTTTKKTTTKKTTTATEVAEAPPRKVPLDSIDYNTTGFNPISIAHIHKSDIMYRLRMERFIDFKEKCNTPFLNAGYEFNGYLIDAVKQGRLMAYNADLTEEIPMSKFNNSLRIKNDEDTANDFKVTPRSLTSIRIIEDYLFDKQRSQTFYDILSVSLFIPGGTVETQPFDQPIGTFRYADIEKVLDSNPNALWRNNYNNAENRRFSDAFRLRLFCGRITKISKDNPNNVDVSALPSVQKEGIRGELLASQQYEYDLVSMENELYEY